MKIQIGGLSEGIHRYSFTEPAPVLGLGDDFRGDVVVETTLDKGPSQIFLTSIIRATGHFVCDRCLTPFSVALAPAYTMVYVGEGAETSQIEPSEVQVIPAGYHVIDIADDVRQTLLLAVPLKLLCRESCRGLCRECGTNLNQETCSCSPFEVDPRWEALRDLPRN